MADWSIRDVNPADLEALVRLDDLSSTTNEPPVFPLADVVLAVSERHPAVVVQSNGQVVGAAISRVMGDQAWIMRLAISPEFRGRGVGSALIAELEHQLVASGVRRIRALLPNGETGAQAFRNSGFFERGGLTWYEKAESVTPHAAQLLRELGGTVPPAGLWERVSGMRQEKLLIERRLVLPLAMPGEAQSHGVEPPRAVVLFGPPGTGKTTFARAVASRLNWPFLELFPSRMASGSGGLAAGIGEVFARISELDHVVVFIDEVEEIAAARESGASSVAVVNELLKALVSFRESAGRLLVCATNSVGTLDSAFLRHGRFDYVLPIGPPDADARLAMWQERLSTAGDDLDAAELVDASVSFTPADIAHVARAVAQRTFECSVDSGQRCRATIGDYLELIDATKPTLSPPTVEQFALDIERFSRT